LVGRLPADYGESQSSTKHMERAMPAGTGSRQYAGQCSYMSFRLIEFQERRELTMELHKLTDDLAVSGQIEPGDIPALAAKGVRAIICNRPDGEAPGQPAYREIEQAAKAQGMQALYQPVVSSAITDADVETFDRALESLPKPILAYCRSGARCTALWSLGQAGKRPTGDILMTALEAGYDLRGLLPRLEKRD
jgi:sulfide:quinone oxidoreductase